MGVTTRGDREISLRFEQFPARARGSIEARIRNLTDELDARIENAAPFRTGKLRSEITPSVYDDSPDRVAGVVSVFAPQAVGEYAKAATLEYGSNKPRRIFDRSSSMMAKLLGSRRRVASRMTKPVHIAALAYLRGPFAEMEPEIQAELEAALAEATEEGNA